MRGLKQGAQGPKGDKGDVASFTDAWIETESPVGKSYVRPVASFTDAWIETLHLLIIPNISLSHLLQMRGLKHAL